MSLLRRVTVAPRFLLVGVLFALGCSEPDAPIPMPPSVEPLVQIGESAVWPSGPGQESAQLIAERFAIDVLLWEEPEVLVARASPEEAWVSIANGGRRLGLVVGRAGPEDWRVRSIQGGGAFPSTVFLGRDASESNVKVQFVPPDDTSQAIVHVRDKDGVMKAWQVDVAQRDASVNRSVRVPVPDLGMGEITTVLVIYEDESAKRTSADGGLFIESSPD